MEIQKVRYAYWCITEDDNCEGEIQLKITNYK
jgi:hypothetical protein